MVIARFHLSVAMLLAFCLSNVGQAQDSGAARPYEARQRQLAAEVVQLARSPRAMIPLLQLWRGYGDAAPEVTTRALESLARNRQLLPSTRMYAAQLHARALTREGDVEGSRGAFDELGFIRAFRVVGPFDNEGKTGFDREYEPEALRMQPSEAGATFAGRERAVRWRPYPDISNFGYISFDAVFRPDTNVCAYAETFVTSPRAQPLTLWVGGGGATRAFWNGQAVIADSAYRQPDPDRGVAMVAAQAGPNRLLVKTCVTRGTWGFFARVGDAQGQPIQGLTFAAEGDANAVHPATNARLPRAPEAPLAALQRAASGRSPSPQALEDLSRFLSLTGADDPAEQDAKQLAARAVAAAATAERVVLASRLATSRGESWAFLDRASDAIGRSPEVLYERARLTSTGPSPSDALEIIDRIPRGTTHWLAGQLLRAEILNSMRLPESARATIEQTARFAPGSATFLAQRIAAAEATERTDTAIALRRELVGLRWDDLGSRRVLIADALQRGERDAVLEHLDVYRRLGSEHTQTYRTVAETFDALGDEASMLGAYRAAIDLAPEDANARAVYGRALLRAQQGDAASEMLRSALALRPQDADTRELLERIRPEERRDESFAVNEQTLLARRREERGYPARILQNLTVNTVFPSGLGSSFHQIAVQIVDPEGARNFRTFPIQFDPDVQRVTVRAARVYRGGQRLQATQTYEQQMGEPWYRIWYDTRSLVVVMPDLEPGDVVELRYRIDDVAERNQFHDYYGDLHHLAGNLPIARMEYVLISPSARTFYFNEPRLSNLRHEQSVEGDTRIDHFVAEDVPAIDVEDNMPGYTEIAPYLHVSTYRSWADVGRWYWGLVHDQLYADERLRGVVRELTRAGGDTRAKVERIYDWVIRNTRYVGLEFGIHGFLPYRVPQIVQRGFGDCKDKASLLYTMLREAGIDARLVLTRTRRNGAIHDLPASLAVFDHAIAYVPELDLYLDGTAEFSGIGEFPPSDQGVTVLHVWPEGAELHRTPVLPASANARSRTIQVELAPEGAGRITVDEEIRGAEAPGYRNTYQAEGTRSERLERSLRGIFAGIHVRAQRMEGLNRNGDPVVVHYEADVPQMAVVDADGLRTRVTVLDSLTRLFARSEDRRHPLDLGGTSTYREERHVRMPNGSRALALPEGGTAESPFGRLTLQISEREREVVATTELTIIKDRLEPGEYEAFRQWTARADVLLRQRIVLGGGR